MSTGLVVPGRGDHEPIPPPPAQESERITLARIRSQLVKDIFFGLTAFLSPVATALGAYWLSRVDTKVEQVETRQAENAQRIEDVHRDVGATSQEVKATRAAVNDRKKAPIPAKEDE